MSASEWTIRTSRADLLAQMEANDRRYQERFTAQEHAIELALATVNREFAEHLIQARSEARLALAAIEEARRIQQRGSERALDLASAQMDARLDKLNEFRAALADAHDAMMPRAETMLLATATDDRIAATDRAVEGLGRDVVELRAGLAGAGVGAARVNAEAEKTRNIILVGAAVAAIAVSLFLGLRHSTTASFSPTTPVVTTSATTR